MRWIPALYLKAISTGDLTEALSAILGKNAAGLSRTNIVRLKRGWEEEYTEWSRRDLSDKHYVCFWADGIYFNVRLEPDRPCLLVIIGTLLNGTKELAAVQDGASRGQKVVAGEAGRLEEPRFERRSETGDGGRRLGLLESLGGGFPGHEAPATLGHKTANVLNKLPKRVQPHAKNASARNVPGAGEGGCPEGA